MAPQTVLGISDLRSKIGPGLRFKVRSNGADRSSAQTPFSVSYAAFQLLFENNPHPMWIYELGTLRFLAVNDAAIRNYMYSADEFATMTLEQIHVSEEIPSLQEHPADPHCGSNGSGMWRHRRKDGTVFDAEITSHSMMFNDREARVVLATDVTGRERAKQALRESQERYRDLFDHADEIVFTTDLEGNFTSLNKAGEVATGYSSEEALGRNLGELIGPKYLELARSMREQKMVSGGKTIYEIEIASKDGQLITLAVSTSLIYKDGKPSGIRGIAQNITERKQLEERLRQSQKMEALGRLAGGIAHDFNNQLGVITGFGEVLVDRLQSDQCSREFANEILKAGRQAASLTGQLLAFSRQQVLKPKVLDLNASIGHMKQLLRRLIREDIELTMKLARELGRVKVDLGQIEQVVMNLAVNARDAMPQGGELTIETANADLDETDARRFPYVVPGRYVRLTVRDTGIGMDDQTQARIFEPFFTTKQLGKGTGLGLATVYGIVKQSGGYIWVQSQSGKGTSFSVYFPSVNEPVADSPAGRDRMDVLTGTETILLVEDAEPFRRLMRMLLESSGYVVLDAAGGAEAAQIAAIHKGPIHLLLTDVIMPQISGYQLSDHLRFLRSEMKVLCMSGYTGCAGVGHVELKPGTTLLPKPFSRDALLAMVRQILDEPQWQDKGHALEEDATELMDSGCRDGGVRR